MQKEVYVENSNYEYIDVDTIKNLSDQTLISKLHNTQQFLSLCEIYLKNVKDDYGKKKIAGLRVDFVRHQLNLLIKECFAREIDHGLNSHYIMEQ